MDLRLMAPSIVSFVKIRHTESLANWILVFSGTLKIQWTSNMRSAPNRYDSFSLVFTYHVISFSKPPKWQTNQTNEHSDWFSIIYYFSAYPVFSIYQFQINLREFLFYFHLLIFFSLFFSLKHVFIVVCKKTPDTHDLD